MNTPSQPSSWLGNFFTLLFGPKMLVMLMTGFSSGLPLLLTGSTLKFWMREEGLDLTTIGFFGLVGLPYTLKFLWAPLMDRIIPPFGGRRRGWMLITQVFLMITLAIQWPLSQPSDSFTCHCRIMSSHRVCECQPRHCTGCLPPRIFEQMKNWGLARTVFVNGYRIGLLASGALALVLAEYLSWPTAYLHIGNVYVGRDRGDGVCTGTLR